MLRDGVRLCASSFSFYFTAVEVELLDPSWQRFRDGGVQLRRSRRRGCDVLLRYD